MANLLKSRGPCTIRFTQVQGRVPEGNEWYMGKATGLRRQARMAERIDNGIYLLVMAELPKIIDIN